MRGHGQPIRGLAPEGAKQALAGRHGMRYLLLIVSRVPREDNRIRRLRGAPIRRANTFC
jgi:hypothetical protein